MSANSKSAPIARASHIAPSLEALPEVDENAHGNGFARLHVDRMFQGKESILTSQISLFVEETKPKIPDGGWGWLVLLAAFLINMVSEGVIFTFGLLYIQFLNEFGASKSATSWIGSLFMAIPLLAGPIASAFVDRYGCKWMTVVGSVICAFGFVLSAYTRTIGVMYVTFGVIGGLGRGLSYVTAVVSIAFWFEKKRALVLGLAASGAGIGTVVFSPLSTFLINEYGWRGTVLIFAGFFFNMCVCGMLMRNPDWIIEEERRALKEEAANKNNPNARKHSSFSREVALHGEDHHLLHTIDKDHRHGKRRMSELNLPTYVTQTEKLPVEILKQLSENKEVYKVIVENYPNLVGCKCQPEAGNKNDSTEAIPSRRNSEHRRKSHQHSHSYLRNVQLRKNSNACRSAMNIHRYRLTSTSCPQVYRKTVTNVDVGGREKWYEEYVSIVKELTHFSLFLELHFFLLALSTIILFIWFIVPYFYLAEHMTRVGYSDADASFVLSVIGFANTIGMVGLGWAGDRLNVAKTYAICLILTGISAGAMMFFTHHYILLLVSSASFGLFFASCFSLTPSLLAQLVSLEDFTMAYGLVLLCDGIGNLIGPPLAGMLFDLTQSWNQSFYQAAFWIIISGILIGIIPYTKNRKFCGAGKTPKETQRNNVI